jgi:hypothetical protein
MKLFGNRAQLMSIKSKLLFYYDFYYARFTLLTAVIIKYCLVGYEAALTGRNLPTFRRNLLLQCYPEDGGRKFPRNFKKFLADYTCYSL